MALPLTLSWELGICDCNSFFLAFLGTERDSVVPRKANVLLFLKGWNLAKDNSVDLKVGLR
jgi:hypothetical protein